jgi:radical SAM protein with 4Fe4S-binding SPASM domain
MHQQSLNTSETKATLVTEKNIAAVIQPRIHAAAKVPLEDQVPLTTPFSVHIDVCSVCNYKCSFCFQADSQAMKAVGLKRGMMSQTMFKKIVDELSAFDQKIKKIKIGNHGEPTLHPELPAMIRYARDSGTAEIIELFTNASQLEPKLNQALIDSGLQRINISLEGLSDERYQQVAGVKQSFAAIVEGVRHLHSIRGDCKIYVKIADQTSALSRNITQKFVLTDAEREYFFDTFGNICDEIFIEKVVPQWAEVQLDKQNQVSETGMYAQKVKVDKDVCPFIFMYLHFNCDGTVSPCTLDWPRKVVIGNIEQQSVKEIWNGQQLRALQVAMLEGKRCDINFCKNCTAPVVCVEEDLDPHKDNLLKKILPLLAKVSHS